MELVMVAISIVVAATANAHISRMGQYGTLIPLSLPMYNPITPDNVVLAALYSQGCLLTPVRPQKDSWAQGAKRLVLTPDKFASIEPTTSLVGDALSMLTLFRCTLYNMLFERELHDNVAIQQLYRDFEARQEIAGTLPSVMISLAVLQACQVALPAAVSNDLDSIPLIEDLLSQIVFALRAMRALLPDSEPRATHGLDERGGSTGCYDSDVMMASLLIILVPKTPAMLASFNPEGCKVKAVQLRSQLENLLEVRNGINSGLKIVRRTHAKTKRTESDNFAKLLNVHVARPLMKSKSCDLGNDVNGILKKLKTRAETLVLKCPAFVVSLSTRVRRAGKYLALDPALWNRFSPALAALPVDGRGKLEQVAQLHAVHAHVFGNFDCNIMVQRRLRWMMNEYLGHVPVSAQSFVMAALLLQMIARAKACFDHVDQWIDTRANRRHALHYLDELIYLATKLLLEKPAEHMTSGLAQKVKVPVEPEALRPLSCVAFFWDMILAFKPFETPLRQVMRRLTAVCSEMPHLTFQ